MQSVISLELIKANVRDIPDFPKPGIIFKDITPVLAIPGALQWVCGDLARPFRNERITKVLAIESRGFLFGAAVAEVLNAGVVPVRKKGKLPWRTISESYSLEYGEAVLEIHEDSITSSDRILIVDDVLATGGTLGAAKRLAEKLGAEVVGAACFLELGFLEGRGKIAPARMHSTWII